MNTHTFLFQLNGGHYQTVDVRAISFHDALTQLNAHVQEFARNGDVVTEIRDTVQDVSNDILPVDVWNERILPGGYRDAENQRTAQYIASNGPSHGVNSTQYELDKVSAAVLMVQTGRSEWRYLTQWASGTTCWESEPLGPNARTRQTCTVSTELKIR